MKGVSVADISDVETSLVAIAANSLGLGDSYLAGSLVLCSSAGARCRVYRGWPIASSLDADLAAGIVNVSVFPLAGATRNVTKYLPEWKLGAPVIPTMVATLVGSTVTFTGTGGAGQVAGVRFDQGADRLSYAYRLQPGDDNNVVARSLQRLIPGSNASGGQLVLPTDVNARALVVADQPEWLETRRQEQAIKVIGWCPTPIVRDQIMSLVDAGFANMLDQFNRLTSQFGLPDGSDAYLCYVSNHTDDAPQQDNLWRRDLTYRVQYPTTLLETHPSVIFVGGTISVDDTDSIVTFGDLYDGVGTVVSAQPNQTISATAHSP